MTRYQQKVLEAVQRCPGAGRCNVCNYLGGLSPLDIHNAERALKWLRDRKWLDDHNYLTPAAEAYLNKYGR